MRPRGRPSKKRVERVSQPEVIRDGGIIERLGKADLRPLVHFSMFAISCVYSDDVRFVAQGFGVVLRSAKRFCPVGSEPLRVLGVIYARERVAYDGVGQASRMPCVRQGEQGGLSASDKTV